MAPHATAMTSPTIAIAPTSTLVTIALSRTRLQVRASPIRARMVPHVIAMANRITGARVPRTMKASTARNYVNLFLSLSLSIRSNHFAIHIHVRKFFFLPVSACDSNPCLNSGTCNSYGYFYYCTCDNRHYGENCELEYTMPDMCEVNPCQNDGICVRYGEEKYYCACQYGFYGDHCEKEYTYQCANSPCQNGATCTCLGYDYKCTCTNEYHGKNCSEPYKKPDPCLSNPCLNDGSCRRYDEESYLCICNDIFYGQFCELFGNFLLLIILLAIV